VHTFADVAAAHPHGIPAAASVWLWKRVLEQLGWVHRAGFAHGALSAPHLLVHARDHGVALLGWSHAVPPTPSARAADLAASAHCVLTLLRDGATPEPLARLLRTPADDAWQVRDQLDATARQVFGPPKYIPLPMPGWN